MFIRGNTLKLQHVMLPVLYVLDLCNMLGQGAMHQHYAIGTLYVHQAFEVGIETIYWLYAQLHIAQQALCIGTGHKYKS